MGRRAEIEDLRATCRNARLLTLIGVGGCGKTRLALEVARDFASDFPDGVAFTDLSSTQEGAAVTESVAASLGFPKRASEQIAELVADARVLLVVDNAEHLVESVSVLVEQLLFRCPNIGVLVTSRQPLHVLGEVCRDVPPLEVPEAETQINPMKISAHDSVQLFIARVTEQYAAFKLTRENATLIATICRRLDGIPLALELAAARVRALGLAEVAARLDNAFDLLTSRSRLERHRTLRTTIDWSHQLLDESECCLFRRLGVFSGTFDLAAIESVCSGDEVCPREVADVVQRLVDKSLVVAEPRIDGTVRYRLLETLRQYARERLVGANESEFDARHARYYADLVHRLTGEDEDGNASARGEALTMNYDNVQLALDWATTGDPKLEATMVDDLLWFWRLRGAIREANERIGSVLAKDCGPRSRQARLCIQIAGNLCKMDLERGAEFIERAAALVDERTDPELFVGILNLRGCLKVEIDQLAAAEHTFQRAIELSHRLPQNKIRAMAVARNNLAMALLCSGRSREAAREAERAIEVMTQLPESARPFPELLHTYGSALLAIGRVAEARDQFLTGLRQIEGNNSHYQAAAQLLGLACIAATKGQHATCLTLLSAARSLGRMAGVIVQAALCPLAPILEAERVSRAGLSDDAARNACEEGLQMDLSAAHEFARRCLTGRPDPLLGTRKLEIVRLVAQGFSDKEIARRLSISQRTVESHLQQTRHLLGCHNRTQVATWAVSTGLVSVKVAGRHEAK